MIWASGASRQKPNNRGELNMGKVKTISTKELQQRLERGNSLHFWNVLTDGYFKGEMIPGSRRVPLDTIGRDVSESQSPKGEEIVVYCGGPKCPQSLQAAQNSRTWAIRTSRPTKAALKSGSTPATRSNGFNKPARANYACENL
jgi:rhodanese-related sulfurtransferase